LADEPYSNFGEDELILRDYLAIDRTILANDRTVLAFVRTALALFLTGVTLIKLFGPGPIVTIGWTASALGTIVLVMGLVRYRKMQRSISALNFEREPGKKQPLIMHSSTGDQIEE
jgi:putative membrane protein